MFLLSGFIFSFCVLDFLRLLVNIVSGRFVQMYLSVVVWYMFSSLVFSRHEVSTGHSWQGYAALDLYVRTHVRGMAPQEEEAHYLLMSAEAPRARILPWAGSWYELPIMVGWGQRYLPGTNITDIWVFLKMYVHYFSYF